MGTMIVKVVLTTDPSELICASENHGELQIIWANAKRTLVNGYDAPERVEELESTDERSMKSAYADGVKQMMDLHYNSGNEQVRLILKGEFCAPYSQKKVVMELNC